MFGTLVPTHCLNVATREPTLSYYIRFCYNKHVVVICHCLCHTILQKIGHTGPGAAKEGRLARGIEHGGELERAIANGSVADSVLHAEALEPGPLGLGTRTLHGDTANPSRSVWRPNATNET